MYVPNVLSMDDDGHSRVYDIYSKLANDRNLFLVGEIDRTVSTLIIAQLLFLNVQDGSTPICLYINSPGGDAISALAIVDAIKSIAAPVYTYCIGSCSSAAALVFSSGSKGNRALHYHSRMMIHMVSGSAEGKIDEIRANYQLMESLNDDICQLIADNTGKPSKQIKLDIESDRWYRASEAIEYGLADIIVGIG